ncbi:protein DMP2-like [Phoenix dactylifera]|uniref:Protein DMP2-like n=1 Tax=Phoenix dactylifera TaxID=42345 RepID=A0A8B7CYA2_PHODC|nr:protein DMP2-like [Phoenix dactylifera]
MTGENQSSTSSSNTTTKKNVGDKTFQGVGNLIKVLPSGTVFLFQFLNPLLTNKGSCHTANKYLAGALLIICGLSCFFASFTDSHVGSNGKIYYGVATMNGLHTFSDPDSSKKNLSKYKLRFSDFVHAFLALIIFAVIALLNSNTIKCFYPSFESTEKKLMMALPVVVGGISSFVFMVFPSTRHGVGYPPTQTKDDSSE